MTERENLIQSIWNTIADYRQDVIVQSGPDHVETWINQFGGSVQLQILKEMDHVLKQTYLPKSVVEEFLSGLVTNEKLVGGEPRAYWQSVEFIKMQQRGNSQRDMLRLFGDALNSQCGLNLDQHSGSSNTFIYLDDGIYTGNNIIHDLGSWIKTKAPNEAVVNIIVIALHSNGRYYADSSLKCTSREAGKSIKINWWRSATIEDQKISTDSSDVLRPTEIPDDPLVREYVDNMKYKPVLRRPGSLGSNKFFSSEEGRYVLEQEFLKAGVLIRSMCPNLNLYQRPLGNSRLETLGFGSLLVTFRNCPNNAPLALWVGYPWYPLFPRRTN